MRKRLIGIGLLAILFMVTSPSLGAVTEYNAEFVSGDLGITIDGQPSDWVDIDKADVDLHPAVVGTGHYEASVQAVWNDTHVAFMISVVDDYDFEDHNTGSHRNSSALGVLFVIDGDADAIRMGGTGDYANETSVGHVDIWHWELDEDYGVLSGGTEDDDATNGGNDPDGNLDDEYSKHSEDRHDDDGTGAENNLWGAYGHSGGTTAPAIGTAGTWYFEIMRTMTNGDVNDVQFESGESYFMNLAYWDADETGEQMGWTDDGHYVLETGADAIVLSFNKPASAPGFEIIVVIGSVIILATIVLKKRN
ncbi:MAG: hypothetical protein HeimC3_09420 [Candidatus Heimdallarchaeota archaeon LC_3]|nr:MAG: hypothetical protein HeimC3_09420 [Candidatus Heimdallarchaeota archaeon LC_3]